MAIVRTDGEHAAITVIQVGLEDLDLLFSDQGTADPPEEFLRFPAEHHSRNDFNPTVLGAVVHRQKNPALSQNREWRTRLGPG